MDPTRADIDPVSGEPKGAAALPLQPDFVRGEEVRTYEGAVLTTQGRGDADAGRGVGPADGGGRWPDLPVPAVRGE